MYLNISILSETHTLLVIASLLVNRVSVSWEFPLKKLPELLRSFLERPIYGISPMPFLLEFRPVPFTPTGSAYTRRRLWYMSDHIPYHYITRNTTFDDLHEPIDDN